jgi:uncharacterized protein (TIGR00369 family)
MSEPDDTTIYSSIVGMARSAPETRKNAGEIAPDSAAISEPSHRTCIICGRENDHGMHVQFRSEPDGSVMAAFHCDPVYQGYPEVLHGGVVASLLDGAMTNCLFAHGIVAVTAELTIRYLQPVRIGDEATVRAWVVKSSTRLQIVAGELLQGGEVRAKAQAKFRNIKVTQDSRASE